MEVVCETKDLQDLKRNQRRVCRRNYAEKVWCDEYEPARRSIWDSSCWLRILSQTSPM